MSYCDPSWVSDYTYKALFKRLTFVSSSPKLIIDPELLDRSYDAIRVLDGVAEWSGTITRHDPPMATPRSVLVSSPARGTRTVAGYYYPYDHITGGMLYIRRPKYTTPADELSLAEFTAEGELFTLSK